MTPQERFPWATILPFEGQMPQIHETAFVAPGARIIGDVTLGPQASVWYNCVLRGDIHRIVVGARSNVQDGSVFHVEGPRPDTEGCPTIVGEDCVIGHMAVVHGCTLENRAFVGMGAVAMDDCRIGEGAMLAAGALLSPGKHIPPREIWVGRPAKFLRTQDQAQVEKIRFQTERYCRLAERHRASSVARPKPELPSPEAIRALADADGRLALRVTPGARSETVEIGDRVLLVKVRAKPKDGEANEAVLALVARALGVATSRLRMLRGATGRDKLVQLEG